MALNVAALKASPGLPGAGGADYPATTALCAQAWADAVQAFAAAVVPASTTVAAAAATLSTALLAAFNSGAAAAPMETAFTAFATTVGAGMAAAGYTGAPPPAPVGFSTIFAAPHPSTRQAGVDAVADAILAWALTGSATLIAPPNTVVPWS